MRLFFYGTLIAGAGNEVARAVHTRLRPLGPGIAHGRLYAIGDPQGWYPAMLPGLEQVRGMLYETTAEFGRTELNRLDAYEDFDPANPKDSLFLRRQIFVADGKGATRRAHAYCFNSPIPPGARPIPRGDFRAWLADTGFRSFADSM